MVDEEGSGEDPGSQRATPSAVRGRYPGGLCIGNLCVVITMDQKGRQLPWEVIYSIDICVGLVGARYGATTGKPLHSQSTQPREGGRHQSRNHINDCSPTPKGRQC